jgi:sporulation protein YlmC with PRC-barrel domain
MRNVALALALAATVSATGATAQTPAPAGSNNPAPTMQRSTTAPGDAVVIKVDVARVALGHRASKLVGAAVVNSKDERIGTIDDLVVNPDDRITYAILSVGGFVGIGSKLVAVPFHALQMVKEDRLMLPGGSKEALKDLPEFKYAKG